MTIEKKWKTLRIPSIHGYEKTSLVVSKSIILCVRYNDLKFLMSIKTMSIFWSLNYGRFSTYILGPYKGSPYKMIMCVFQPIITSALSLALKEIVDIAIFFVLPFWKRTTRNMATSVSYSEPALHNQTTKIESKLHEPTYLCDLLTRLWQEYH